MEKKRIKYVVLGFIFLGIGIVLASFFKNKLEFSRNEYILSCIALMLLILAPYFLFKSKPSKYFVLALVFSSLAYVILFVLQSYSNLSNYFQDIGVLIFTIFALLTTIFSLIAGIYSLRRFIRLFKRKD